MRSTKRTAVVCAPGFEARKHHAKRCHAQGDSLCGCPFHTAFLYVHSAAT